MPMLQLHTTYIYIYIVCMYVCASRFQMKACVHTVNTAKYHILVQYFLEINRCIMQLIHAQDGLKIVNVYLSL